MVLPGTDTRPLFVTCWSTKKRCFKVLFVLRMQDLLPGTLPLFQKKPDKWEIHSIRFLFHSLKGQRCDFKRFRSWGMFTRANQWLKLSEARSRCLQYSSWSIWVAFIRFDLSQEPKGNTILFLDKWKPGQSLVLSSKHLFSLYRTMWNHGGQIKNWFLMTE